MSDTNYIPPETVNGITTSWLPVTSAYPYLPGCSSAFFLYPGQPLPPVAFDPGLGYFAGDTLSCDPPAFTSWHELEHQNPDGFTTLSIQPIVCPAAFTTAATAIRSESSTNVMCCPSGYDLNRGQPGEIAGICQSPLSSGQTLTYLAQATDDSWTSATLTITNPTSLNAVAMIGWNVARSTTSASSTSTTKSAPTSTTISNSTPQASSGLSTGAKAGIGIGVALGVIGILCLLLSFCWLRKRRRDHYDTAPISPAVEAGAAHEMNHKQASIHEIQPKQASVYEMHHRQDEVAAELETR